MENIFTEQMLAKSDEELQAIIWNKLSYQEDAYLAAVSELEKRKIASVETIKERDAIINKPEKEEQKEKDEVVKKRKSFRETLEALIPGKNYYITPIIIYLNILVYIVMVLNGVHSVEPSVQSLINWGGDLRELTLSGQQWRLLTSIFLHAGIFHLLLNMYALIYIGKEIETQFGNKRYLFTYLATGILASITSIYFNDNLVSVGASGAIFGMYGLLLSMFLNKQIDIPQESRKSFLTSVISFVGYNLLYGFTKEGIDNAAHIGGLLSGFFIGGVYFLFIKNSKFVSFGITLGVAVLILFMPKFIPNQYGNFQMVMEQFLKNEDRALWMYKEDFSYIPQEKIAYYNNKFKKEGTELWNENLALLDSLKEVPPELEKRVSLLKEYSRLRIKSCEIMPELILFNEDSDLAEFENINKKIEKIINDIEALHQ